MTAKQQQQMIEAKRAEKRRLLQPASDKRREDRLAKIKAEIEKGDILFTKTPIDSKPIESQKTNEDNTIITNDLASNNKNNERRDAAKNSID